MEQVNCTLVKLRLEGDVPISTDFEQKWITCFKRLNSLAHFTLKRANFAAVYSNVFLFEAIRTRAKPLRTLNLTTKICPIDHYSLIQMCRRSKILGKFKIKGPVLSVAESQ